MQINVSFVTSTWQYQEFRRNSFCQCHYGLKTISCMNKITAVDHCDAASPSMFDLFLLYSKHQVIITDVLNITIF